MSYLTNPYRFAVALTDPDWADNSTPSGLWTISTTTTTNDTGTRIGATSAGSWAYDQEAINASGAGGIEFQLNGSTFFTATDAKSTINGYYAIAQTYLANPKFISSKTATTYNFQLTNASDWQPSVGMDSTIGFNDTTTFSAQSSKWMVVGGERGGTPKIEVWKGGSGDIKYTASTTLSNNDIISVIYA